MADENSAASRRPSRVRKGVRATGAAATTAVERGRRAVDWTERHPILGVLLLTGRRIGAQSVPTFAAAIAFQALISLLPLVAVVVAFASFFIDADTLKSQVLEAMTFLAPGSADLLADGIRSITELRGQVGAISLLGLLWTGSNLFGSMRRGLNAATGATRRRAFVHGRAIDIGVAILTALVLLVSVAATAGSAVLQKVELEADSPLVGALGVAITVVAALVPIALTTFIFFVLYRVVPAERLAWRPSLLGAAVAAVGFEVGKNAFVWYAANFGSFNAVYGPIATVVVLMVWFNYSGLIFFSGAALSHEIAARRRAPNAQAPDESAPHDSSLRSE